MTLLYKKSQFYFTLINPVIPRKRRVCLCYGKDVEKYYDFLERSQWWSRGELENYQNEKLRKLIKHAYENVPYYRNLFINNKLHPADIKTTADLAKLPILTKKIIRKHFPQDITTRNMSSDRIVPAKTGGSTGEPLVFNRDKLSQDLSWGAMFRFFKWIGYEWGDQIAYFWRMPLSKKEKWAWYQYQNILDKIKYSWVPAVDRYDAFRVGEKELAVYVEDLIRSKPQILRGYVNVIVAVARYCKEERIDEIRPKAITTTAEVLHQRERKLLERQFKCDVYDQYGGGETFSVSAECEKHNGLHINSEHCIVEILNDYDALLPNGAKGKIVVTDLDNYAMPFIRYENGDFGSLREERCYCGRALPLMNPVEGRIFGMLKGKNGRVVHGEFFANLLDEFNWYEDYNIDAFEVVQGSEGSVVWYIACGKNPTSDDINILLSCCNEYFGDIDINFEFVREIPLLTSGKRELIRAQAGASKNI